MGRYEDFNVGQANVETNVQPQSHVGGGLRVQVGGTGEPADADIPVGEAIIYYDGTDILAKRNVGGTVESTTLSGVWA